MAEYIERIRIDGTVKEIRDANALHEEDLLERLYPVGALYLSLNLTNPNAFLGGVWKRVEGKFLLGADETYAVGTEGGSADAIIPAHNHTGSVNIVSGGEHTHSLSGTANSAGAHAHGMGNIWSNGSGKNSAYTMSSNRKLNTRNTTSAGAHTHTLSGSAQEAGAHTHAGSVSIANTGVSVEGKNMPPYLAVYIWKRVA